MSRMQDWVLRLTATLNNWIFLFHTTRVRSYIHHSTQSIYHASSSSATSTDEICRLVAPEKRSLCGVKRTLLTGSDRIRSAKVARHVTISHHMPDCTTFSVRLISSRRSSPRLFFCEERMHNTSCRSTLQINLLSLVKDKPRK